jgi:hypothetical protein
MLVKNSIHLSGDLSRSGRMNKFFYRKTTQYISPSVANGVPGFGPVHRDIIMVKRKGQIRDWPKLASYLQKGTE